MAEEIQIQTVDEVKNIDYMKATNEVITAQVEEQLGSINDMSNTLESVNDSLNFIIETGAVSSNNIVDVDTTVIESQIQDALISINNQQEQINNIESTINEINNKLNQLINKEDEWSVMNGRKRNTP